MALPTDIPSVVQYGEAAQKAALARYVELVASLPKQPRLAAPPEPVPMRPKPIKAYLRLAGDGDARRRMTGAPVREVDPAMFKPVKKVVTITTDRRDGSTLDMGAPRRHGLAQHLIEHNGVMKTYKQIAEECGLTKSVVAARVRIGWSLEEIYTYGKRAYTPKAEQPTGNVAPPHVV